MTTTSNQIISFFRSLNQEERTNFLNSLSNQEKNRIISILYANPDNLLFPKQIVPDHITARYIIFRCGRRFGKQLSLDTELPTPNGFIKLANLKIGDELIDEKGNICKVIELFPINYSPEAYKLTFDDGSVVEACADHLWETWDKKARKSHQRSINPTIYPQIRTTKEIYNTLKVGKKQETNHSIPTTLPIQYRYKSDLPIDPYLLGLWLGDGITKSGAIETADIEVLEGVEYNLVPSSINQSKSKLYRIHNLTHQLKAHNLYNNKHIPDDYLYASIDQRISLLQGLMDTDGCCNKTGTLEYCTVLPELAKQVLQLICSLGIKARMYQNESWLYNQRCKDRYRIYFITEKPVFRLKRKLHNLPLEKIHKTRNTHRYITKVEPTPSIPMRCIRVDSPSHQFLITRSFIPTHNSIAGSAFTAKKIMKGAKRIGLAGPSYSDVWKIMVPNVINWFHPSIQKKIIIKQHDNMVILPKDTIIYTFTSEKENRGNSLDILWADEIGSWADCIDEKVKQRFEILDTAVSAGDNPQTIITSTPKTYQLYDLWQKEIDKGNPNYYLQTGNMFDNPTLPQEYIDNEVAKYNGGKGKWGRQELLGELTFEVDGALWTQEILDNTRADSMEVLANPPSLHRRRFDNPIDWFQFFVIGVDPATTANPETSDAWGITVIGIGLDNHAYVIEDRSKVMTPNEAVEVIASLYRKYRCPKIIAESNQGGLMVEMIIRTKLPSVKPVLIHANKSKMTRAQPISILFEQGRAHMVGRFEELEKELCRYTGEEGQKSPNRLDSMVYAIQYALIEPVWNTNSYDNLPKLG